MVECQLPKLEVVGPNPISRSMKSKGNWPTADSPLSFWRRWQRRFDHALLARDLNLKKSAT